MVGGGRKQEHAMAKQEKRFGQTVRMPSTRALKQQLSKHEQLNLGKEALKAALGDAEYEMVFPGSIRVDGDTVTGKMDMGPAGHKMVSASISKKTRTWSQG